MPKKLMGWFVINQGTELQGSRVPHQSLRKGVSTGRDKGRPESTQIHPRELLLEMLTSPSCHGPSTALNKTHPEPGRQTDHLPNLCLVQIQKQRQASATVTGSVSEWGIY